MPGGEHEFGQCLTKDNPALQMSVTNVAYVLLRT